MNIELVRRSLPQRAVHDFATLASTMAEAARLAQSGCVAGTAVVADEQTAGQGRYGRSWHSEKNAGLYVSIVLRPVLAPESLPALTLALGLATAEAIARVTGLGCDLRWPNDVMLGGAKVAGILVQLQDTCFVAGIGINVNHSAFPPEIGAEATSLRLQTNREHSREQLLIALLPAVDSFVTMLAEGGRQVILDAFSRRSSYARDKRVRVDQGAGNLLGTTEGLDESGFLRVRGDDGSENVILSGGVRPA
ncbi:MAG: biotin--[acetyl-CoA-carboxylase] ligase [Candidatus Solibacter usitatus]|nr:biotin--[acetyl-CoA-carboxylase] ligase [Candidatus Solibacter usitatus]